jgi:hypothetical protein
MSLQSSASTFSPHCRLKSSPIPCGPQGDLRLGILLVTFIDGMLLPLLMRQLHNSTEIDRSHSLGTEQ